MTLSGTAGATTATVTGSGTTYNVAVSGMTSDGTVIATIPAGGAADAAGNANTASTSTDNTVTRDATAPTVTINQAAGQNDPTNASPINFTVVFSESVTGFTGRRRDDHRHGGRHEDRHGHRQRHDLQRRGQRHDDDGTVIATIPAGGAQDAAGNGNTASTSTDNTVTYDATRADGDDQPGGRPGRPDERLADQLHGRLQRAGHRLHRQRRHARAARRARRRRSSPAAARPTTSRSAA